MMSAKAYRGIGMEGPIASWYAKNTARDLTRFRDVAAMVAAHAPAGARVLEVAPGPGYLSIELAHRGFQVTALDISRSFVEIAQRHANEAGVAVEVRQGNASEMPFADGSFDFVVCVAAFKNFSNPVGAIDEMHRVLAPGGQAVIVDLRKDATPAEIDAEVRGMRLSATNAWLTRWTFRSVLLKRAYTREQMEAMARQSRFARGVLQTNGIGFELWLTKGL